MRCRATVPLLLWKNVKQDLRRPKGLCCEMLCPALVFIMFGLIRFAINRQEVDVQYGDNQAKPTYYDTRINYVNNYSTYDNFGQSLNDDANTFVRAWWRSPYPYINIARLVCPEDFFNEEHYAAGYLAIVPHPDKSSVVREIVNRMERDWNVSRDEFLKTLNYYNSINQSCEDIFHYQDAVCYPECLYKDLSFTDGSLIKFFDSADDLESYMEASHYATKWTVENKPENYGPRPIGFAVVFDEYSSFDSITYTLRGNATVYQTTDTGSTNVDLFQKSYNQMYFAYWQPYMDKGFAEFQLWINEIIIKNVANEEGEDDVNFQFGVWTFAAAGYSTDGFFTLLSGLLPFVMILAFIYPYFVITGSVVDEKATKIKEGLQMMGSTLTEYWLSVYLYNAIKFFLIALLCTIFSRIFRIFEYSAFGVILVWYYLFMLTLLTSSIMLSTFFDNPKTASMVSTIFLLVLYFINFVSSTLRSESDMTALCLSGPACFAVSTNNFAIYEEGQIGLHWDNVGETYNYFKFETALGMMILDCVIYTIFAMYLDRVLPSRYGYKLKWYFPFQPSFWCNTRQPHGQHHEVQSSNLEDDVYEPVDETQLGKPVITVENLRKEYSTGFNTYVTAVDGVNMKMYENQVFCLLGHNGAGKTTTISMLSGMVGISSGRAIVDGFDVENEMVDIRKEMGVCPQHDVLWSNLSVEEHLRLFALLKGVSRAQVEADVDEMVTKIGLAEKRTKFPTELSGGQKRKLSLGIALIGGSKIVFLDEPTSGMDPHSRRSAWDLIRESKANRCIILTTHYMDEADILGDRIAIMAHGKVKCCGSSLFLKRLYGVGYSFTVSINPAVPLKKVKKPVTRLIADHIPDSKMISAHGAELVYRLPFSDTQNFPNMFRGLDETKKKFAIDNYGISVTTLEEVFMRVGHNQEVELEDEKDENQEPVKTGPQEIELQDKKNPTEVVVQESNKNDDKQTTGEKQSDGDGNGDGDDGDGDGEGQHQREPSHSRSHDLAQVHSQVMRRYSSNNLASEDDIVSKKNEEDWKRMMEEIRVRSQKNLFFAHVKAVLLKKFHYTKRDNRSFMCQVFLPILFICVGFALVDLDIPTGTPRKPLDMTQFDEESSLVLPVNKESSDFSSFYTLWTDDMNTYGELLPIKSGYTDYAWERRDKDNGGYTYLHTLKDNLLDIASDEPHKYIGLYFTNSTDSTGTIADMNIGAGSNISTYHGLPISLNLASNLALKSVKRTASIGAYVQPFPLTSGQSQAIGRIKGMIQGSYLAFGLAFFPVSIMYNVVQERETLTKHQQLVSGMNFIAYWLGSLIFDIIMIIPSCLMAWALAAIFDSDVYQGEAQGPFVLNLILYGCAIVPFTYCFSWAFDRSQRAQYISLLVYMFLGYGVALGTFIMDYIPSTMEANKYIKVICRISPSYTSTLTFMYLSIRDWGIEGVIPGESGPWAWDVSGAQLMTLSIHFVGYFLLALLMEYISTIPEFYSLLGLNINVSDLKPEELDSDVVAEQQRIRQSMGKTTDPIVLCGLRKVYSRKSVFALLWRKLLHREPERDDDLVLAVKDVWYSVPVGQVFGFLGVNGAGKTTTLSMLCGRFLPSSGTAYINQTSISNQAQCRRMIGYCPQFDALFDLLTSKEHLEIYGLIKGLSPEEIHAQTKNLVETLTLTEYVNKPAGTYSGGNKRKLSVALAMIGNPPIIFLDEPSSGMDPVSRRHMWDFISRSMQNRAVILTTHSMEECEALCHRIGIMVLGQLRCLGTAQRLKSRFGKGYQLDMDVDPTVQDSLVTALQYSFGSNNVIILEKHGNSIKLRITPPEEYRLAEMFEALEKVKQQVNIKSYALNQTTLEQIFIQMAAGTEKTH